MVEEQLATCPELSRADVALDCAEFPCKLLFRRSLLGVPGTCDLLKEATLHAKGLGPPGPGLEQEWASFDFAAPLGRVADAYLPKVQQREVARVAELERWLARRGVDEWVRDGRRSCEEVATLLERDRSEGPCAAVAASWGCTERPAESIPLAVVERHVAAAHRRVQELAKACPMLAGRPYVVDCSDLPCVLAVDTTVEGSGQLEPKVLCGDQQLLGQLDTLTAKGHPSSSCEPIAVIPLFDAGDLVIDAPQVDEQYETERSWRLERACDLVQDVRDAR